MAVDPALIPGHDGLKELLSAENAPGQITLDLGDAVVTARLDEDGELVFEEV